MTVDIKYTCRHCGTSVGTIKSNMFKTNQLGFDQLNVDERKEMIRHETNGDVVVQTICEDCQEALERNPQYHEWDTFIQ